MESDRLLGTQIPTPEHDRLREMTFFSIVISMDLKVH